MNSATIAGAGLEAKELGCNQTTVGALSSFVEYKCLEGKARDHVQPYVT